MKNKKGFTLTELLGVISILAIILSISIAVFLKVKDNVLKKDYENVVKYLETEAANYAKDTGFTTTTVENLIKEGYVSPDDETDIYNPITNESLNCYIISSVMEDGTYKATLGDDIGSTSGTCNSYETNQDLEICKLSNDKKSCDDLSNDWINENITLGVKDYNGNIINSDENTYKWQSNDGNTSTEYSITTNTEIVSNNVYNVEIIFSDKKVGKGAKEIKIDKQAPVVLESSIFPESDEWAKEKTLTLKLSDYSGSGIYGINVNNEKISTCSNNKNDYTNLNENTTAEVKITSKENYICIIDNAGNTLEKPLEIIDDKIDGNGVDYINVEASTNSYTTSLNLIGTAKDEQSGLVSYQFTTSANEPTSGWIDIPNKPLINKEFKTTYSINSNGTYYFWVKDAIGSISSAKITISKIDKGIDTISLTPSTTKYVKSLTLTGKATDNLSGIVKYQITTSSTKPTSGWTTTSAKSSITTTKNISTNGTYYLWVEDAVGNSSKASYKISNIDNEGPVYVSGGAVSLGSVTTARFNDVSTPISVYYYVTTSSTIPSASTITSTSRTFSTSCNNRYYVWAKAVDALGNYTIKSLGNVYAGDCCSEGTYEYYSCTYDGYQIESRYNACINQMEFRQTSLFCEYNLYCENWGECTANNTTSRICYYNIGGVQKSKVESTQCTYYGGSTGGSTGGSSGGSSSGGTFSANVFCSNYSSCQSAGYGQGQCDLAVGSGCGTQKYFCSCCSTSSTWLGGNLCQAQ